MSELRELEAGSVYVLVRNLVIWGADNPEDVDPSHLVRGEVVVLIDCSSRYTALLARENGVVISEIPGMLRDTHYYRQITK